MMKYAVGDIIEGTVTGIESYGIFLSIDENVSGLIHISEISDSYVRNIFDCAKINDVICAKVLDFDSTGKKLKLTIKDFNCLDGSVGNVRIQETGLGFGKLAKALPFWIKEKMNEIQNDEKLKKTINIVDKSKNS